MEEANGFMYRRTGAILLFFVPYCVPSAVVTALGARAFPVSPAALLAAGPGGYALLFLLLVYGVPEALERRGRSNLARRWKCTAFDASLPMAMPTILWTVAMVPVGSMGIRIAVGSAVAVVIFAGLLWLRSWQFDAICRWPR